MYSSKEEMGLCTVAIGVSHAVYSSKAEGEVVTSLQLCVCLWDTVMLAFPFLHTLSQPKHLDLEKLFLCLVLLCSVQLMKQETQNLRNPQNRFERLQIWLICRRKLKIGSTGQQNF